MNLLKRLIITLVACLTFASFGVKAYSGGISPLPEIKTEFQSKGKIVTMDFLRIDDEAPQIIITADDSRERCLRDIQRCQQGCDDRFNGDARALCRTRCGNSGSCKSGSVY